MHKSLWKRNQEKAKCDQDQPLEFFQMFHDDFVAGSIVTVSADISAITVVGLSGMLEDSGCLIGWLY